jgi:hypothetical protein
MENLDQVLSIVRNYLATDTQKVRKLVLTYLAHASCINPKIWTDKIVFNFNGSEGTISCSNANNKIKVEFLFGDEVTVLLTFNSKEIEETFNTAIPLAACKKLLNELNIHNKEF